MALICIDCTVRVRGLSEKNHVDCGRVMFTRNFVIFYITYPKQPMDSVYTIVLHLTIGF